MGHCLVKILTNWVTTPHTITSESSSAGEISKITNKNPETPKLRFYLGDNTVLELGLSLSFEGSHHAGMMATLQAASQAK